jgi:tRNA A-37 threonylcarbamoyl transferase component Bud32
LELLIDNPNITVTDKFGKVKSGSASTVWVVQAGVQKIAVKRYNRKGMLRTLKSLFAKSRAEKSWENAHRLMFYGIPTAPPIALLDAKYQSEAFFLSEALDKVNAGAWFRDYNIPFRLKEQVAEKVAILFKQLANQRITHGDMKGGNILVVLEEACLVDLDTMKKHSTSFLFFREWKRDMRRFMRNWAQYPEIEALFYRVLREKGVPGV